MSPSTHNKIGDKSQQTINCTGTDNEQVTNRTKYTPRNKKK